MVAQRPLRRQQLTGTALPRPIGVAGTLTELLVTFETEELSSGSAESETAASSR